MGATKSWILSTDTNVYHAALNPCKALVARLEEHTASFKGYLEKPGGSYWESEFAYAAQDNAGCGWKTVTRIRDIMDVGHREIAAIVDSNLIPPLNNAKHMIEFAVQQPGVTVSDDLTMTYSPPTGTSDEDTEHNRQTVAARAQELKASANEAWAGAQRVAQQAAATGTKIIGELNLAAAVFNVSKAVADTRPADAPIPPGPNRNFYKDWYPKAASTEAATAAADPNAPKIGHTPPLPQEANTKIGNVGDAIDKAAGTAAQYAAIPQQAEGLGPTQGQLNRAAARSSETLETFSRVGKPLGMLGNTLEVANGVNEGINQVNNGKSVGDAVVDVAPKTAGSVAGGLAGAAVGAEWGTGAGATIGSIVPGVGTVAGAVVGAGVGAVVGGIAGSEIGKDMGEGISQGWHAVFD